MIELFEVLDEEKFTQLKTIVEGGDKNGSLISDALTEVVSATMRLESAMNVLIALADQVGLDRDELVDTLTKSHEKVYAKYTEN